MDKYAVIVAAGSGVRMGSDVPKQFLTVASKPLLYYTLNAFLNSYSDLQIVLVLPQVHFEMGNEIAGMTGQTQRIQLVAGGPTRFQSVRNGLDVIKTEAVIFVHDGVRCLVTQQLIQRCYLQALEQGSAIPAVSATDTIRLQQGNSHHLLDRQQVKIIQTPQTFRSNILLPAFKQPEVSTFTDEASVVEAMGQTVHLVEGDYDNIKITRPVDLAVAAAVLQQRSLL